MNKLFKLKYVAPLGRGSFRIHIIESYLLQFFYIFAVALILSTFKIQLGRWETIPQLFLIGFVHIVLLVKLFDINKYRARFKDIYPDEELGLFTYLFLGFVPLFFIAFTIFLCFKNSDDTQKPPRLMKFRYAFSALIPLLGIQIYKPQVGYWSTSPSQYFIVRTIKEVKSIINVKEEDKFKENLLGEYINSSKSELSSTELVLLVAVESARLIKNKERAVASSEDKKKMTLINALKLISFLEKVLVYSENREMKFFEYGPIQWLHPSGPLEIVLLTSVENEVLSKFNKTVVKSSLRIIDGIESKGIKEKYPVEEMEKLLELKRKLYLTNTFKKEFSLRI